MSHDSSISEERLRQLNARLEQLFQQYYGANENHSVSELDWIYPELEEPIEAPETEKQSEEKIVQVRKCWPSDHELVEWPWDMNRKYCKKCGEWE
jgi:uncharacterized protein (DUF1697 family)